MNEEQLVIQDLTAVNQIIESLNRTVDVHGALQAALSRLLEVMDLETGWIFLRDPAAQELWAGRGYELAAHLNLPPALALDRAQAWEKGCDCQGFCDKGKLTEAYNEVNCSRLDESSGDRRGLKLHASTPLSSGDEVLGILNVAAPDWSAFSPRALALLSNVGSHMGTALERARLYDLLNERHINEQKALLQLSNELLCCLELPEMLDHLMEEIPRLLNAEVCALLLHDDMTHDISVYEAKGVDNESIAEELVIPDRIRRSIDDLMHGDWAIISNLSEGPLPNPLIGLQTELGLKTLAAASLLAESGALGLILIGNREGNELQKTEIRFLQLLANQAAIAIEKARLYELELERERMEAELDMARQIQVSLLPRRMPILPGWDLAVYYKTARQVGGDFYDCFLLPDGNSWGFVIADVVDKGVPAALYMAFCRTIFRSTALSGYPPAIAMERANTYLRRDVGQLEDFDELYGGELSGFVSAIYAALDPDIGQVTYVNAGHLPPLWLKPAHQEIEELPARGTVLGVLDRVELQQHQVKVGFGDSLVFYTDGVSEAFDVDGNLFGTERLTELLERCYKANAQGVVDVMVEVLEDFRSAAPPSDDVTIMVIRRETS